MKISIPDVSEMTMLDAALTYAAHGIAVFPVVPNGKEPLVNGGCHRATTDLSVINPWFERTGTANVGMGTGVVNGVMVLDVDIKNGKDGEKSLRELEELHGKLPETRRHNTPTGGYHLFFGIGSQEVPGSVGKIGVGLDIRSEGGHVVVPPSVVSGGQYAVGNPVAPVADAPEWLVRLACEKKAVAESAGKKGEVSEGRRNWVFRRSRPVFRVEADHDSGVKATDDPLMATAW